MDRARGLIDLEAARNRAWRMLRETPRTDRWRTEHAELIDALEVCQIELEMQVESMRHQYEELEARARCSADLYEAAPIAYLVVGPRGILEANRRALDLFGLPRERLIGQKLSHLVVRSDSERLEQHERRVIATDQPQSCELRIISHTGGDQRDVRLESVRASAATELWRTMLLDVSEEKRFERQLFGSDLPQVHRSAARDLVHDLGHLLMMIVASADVALRRLAPDSSAKGSLEALKNAALHGGTLVSGSLRSAARASTSPETDLNKAILRAQPLLSQILGDKTRVRLDLGVQEVSVSLSAAELTQLLFNLTSNARDAMPIGGELLIATESSVSAPPDYRGHITAAGLALVTVTDTGSGMDAGALARAFDPYFTTKGQESGTGLGLSSVRRVVQQAGGEVRLQSAAGRGTRVTVYLPRSGGITRAPARELAESAGKILLVEGDRDVSVAVRHRLQAEGFSVSGASSAEEALELLTDQGTTIALVISETNLGGMQGPELLERAQQTAPHVRTLLLTEGGHQERISSARVPACQILQKPFMERELLEKVEGALSRAHPPRTVLIVEDDLDTRLLYEELLFAEGFRVVSAASGAEAVALCRQSAHQVHAAICDMQLPDASGAAVADDLRTMQPTLSIVFVSGKDPRDPELARALAAPRTTLMRKPFQISDLAGVLRGAMLST